MAFKKRATDEEIAHADVTVGDYIELAAGCFLKVEKVEEHGAQRVYYAAQRRWRVWRHSHCKRSLL